MTEAQLVERQWLQEYVPNHVRLRCAYKRRGKVIVQYTVQLELFHDGTWKPVVRYDNAHGFCHRDMLHPDGTQEKTRMFVGTANDTFTVAIKQAQTHWEAEVSRFLGEIIR
jgi:hypothetical protein